MYKVPTYIMYLDNIITGWWVNIIIAALRKSQKLNQKAIYII